MQHITLRVSGGSVPLQHPLAITHPLARTLLQPALVNEELVADDTPQSQPSIGRVVLRVIPTAILGVDLHGSDLLEAREAVLDGRIAGSRNDDNAAHALRKMVGQHQGDHPAQTRPHHGHFINAQMVQQQHLGTRLITGIHQGEAVAPALAVRGDGGGPGATVAASQKVSTDDEIAVRVQRLAGPDHVIPPALVVLRPPITPRLGQVIIVAVRVVAAGQGMEEQDGVVLLRRQGAVGLIRQLNAGQGFTVIEGEIADAENMGADGAGHGGKKRPARKRRSLS